LAADARSSDGDGGYSRELVVGEVKKSERELCSMLDYMTGTYREYAGNVPEAVSAKHTNAHRKCLGLLRLRPSIFWAVGPNRTGAVYTVRYGDGVELVMDAIDESSLNFDAFVR
jgi:hypothetical protein